MESSDIKEEKNGNEEKKNIYRNYKYIFAHNKDSLLTMII